MISLEGIKELDSCTPEEELKKLISYIERYFSDKNISNAQLENCSKLSSYIKRNNLILGEIEIEKILENKKVENMFKILELQGKLLRVGQFYNLSSLLETYCTKNNIEITKDSEMGLYDKFNNDIDIVKLYLNEISEFKLLTPNEEQELSKLSKLGDEVAREKLINHNLRLVVSIAKNYKNCGIDYPDLIQFGNEGLLVAVEKYNEEMGYRFSTYATYWIRQAITRGIAITSRNIRISVGLHEIIIKVRKATSMFIMLNNGKIPSNNELSEMTGISLDRIKQARECIEMTVSINTPIRNEEKESTLEDIIPDTRDSLEKNLDLYYMRKYLEKIIDVASLNEREEYVIKARNGFYGKILTLEEIGNKYNCTREWARQIEKKAMEKLKTAANVLKTYEMFNSLKNTQTDQKLVFRYSI